MKSVSKRSKSMLIALTILLSFAARSTQQQVSAQSPNRIFPLDSGLETFYGHWKQDARADSGPHSSKNDKLSYQESMQRGKIEVTAQGFDQPNNLIISLFDCKSRERQKFLLQLDDLESGGESPPSSSRSYRAYRIAKDQGNDDYALINMQYDNNGNIDLDIQVPNDKGLCRYIKEKDWRCVEAFYKARLNPLDFWMKKALIFLTIFIVLVGIKIVSSFRIFNMYRSPLPRQLNKVMNLSSLTLIMVGALDVLVVHHMFNELPLSCTSFIGKFVVAVLSISSFFVIITDFTLAMLSLLNSFESKRTQATGQNSKKSMMLVKLALEYVLLLLAMTMFFVYMGGECLMLLLCWNLVPQLFQNVLNPQKAFSKYLVLIGHNSFHFLIIYSKIYSSEIFESKKYESLYLYHLGIIAIQLLITYAFFRDESHDKIVFPSNFVIKHYDTVKCEKENCPICMDHLSEKPDICFKREKKINQLIKALDVKKGQVIITPCQHVFHVKCLFGWIIKRYICPLCRKDLPQLFQ